MHVGMTQFFQADGGDLTDEQVMAADLALADLAEPLGFESIWGVEHHFTGYTMSPSPLQFLTYMAGRTQRIKLGSMVIVLPWHDPVRIAEEIVLLDHMSGGRFILGLGRGTGRIEFEGLRVPMDTARERFTESAEALMEALETGYMEYHGDTIDIPRVPLRPAPLASFKDRIYSATVSPESARLMARLGTGVLVIPQKPWKSIKADADAYREVYLEAIGHEPPPPIISEWVFVDESADRAEELARGYLARYWQSIVDHYEFAQPHLKTIKGYEFHGQTYDKLTAPGGMEKMTEFYIGLHPFGTPEQVADKIIGDADLLGADTFLGVFRYGGMSPTEAERNIRLFTAEVMPALKAHRQVRVPHLRVPAAIPA